MADHDHDHGGGQVTGGTRKRRRLPPEARRKQLLDTAVSIFAKMGLERAGHADIAKAVGVSTATVFNYFPTREALVEAVLDAVEARVDSMFESIGPASKDPQKRVLQMAAAYERMTHDSPDVVKTLLKWGVSFDPSLRPRYLAFQDKALARIGERIPHSPDPRTEARVIYSAANMLATMAFDGESMDVLSGYAAWLARTLANTDR